MALVSQIITDAFRENNLIMAGASETATQQTEALRLLNRLVASVMGNEVGENLAQVPVGTAGYNQVPEDAVASIWQYPPINSMLACNLTSAQTIYLPSSPSDGAQIGVQDIRSNFNTYNLTLDGNGREIESAATLVLSTASLVRKWFYRADLGNWARLATLVAGDTFPFPEEYEDLFVIMLAVRLSPRYGPAMAPASQAAFKRSYTAFIARYVQSAPLTINPDLALSSMSSQSYGGGSGSGLVENYF